MPASSPERDPQPDGLVWLSKFTSEAKDLDDLLLRRGTGHGGKSSWVFFLGQAHSTHLNPERDIGSVSQSTWES